MPAGRGLAPIVCDTCPHACKLKEGQVGLCHARGWRDGSVQPLAYGRITSCAIDPVEKKPLARWNSGSLLLSTGSYGCNMTCRFCQNHSISQAGEADADWEFLAPGALVKLALDVRKRYPSVVGIAHTYNEPLMTWEYVSDVGMLAHRVGLANVLVSNGFANARVIDRIAPVVDAANIDLKGFTEPFYRWCGGDLATVKRTVERLAAEPTCHLEVTTLIVPTYNDSPEEIRAIASWLASLDDQIVLHVSRYFPRWKAQVEATPVATVHALAEEARAYLPYVYTGNC
jgi:pyruvate formate lyase activating enzyme